MDFDFLDTGCFNMYDEFSIEHNGEIVQRMKGFFCGNDYPDSIQLTGTMPISEADWIIHKSTGLKYFIDKILPLRSGGKVFECIAHCQTQTEYSNNQKYQNSFNIGTIYGGAILGNQCNASINNGYNLDDIKSLIQSKPDVDQKLLNQLIERIQIITEDNQPVSKGTLAKFSDVLAKHSDIAIALGQSIIGWLTGK